MIKRFLVGCIMMMVLLSGCGSNNLQESDKQVERYSPKYYWQAVNTIPKAKETENSEEGIQLKKEYLQICEEIYYNVCKYYNIEKDMPNFYIAQEEHGTSTMNVYAYCRENTVFVKEELFSTGDDNVKATIAHEIVHYLGCLIYEEHECELGNAFNEGVTNYLSTQVYTFPEGTSVYEYETHCAKMIANAYGEEKIRESYFNSNVQNLRDDFNNAVKGSYPEYEEISVENVNKKITSFDVFVNNLEFYLIILNRLQNQDGVSVSEKKSWITKILNSCEEELLFYNQQKGTDGTQITKDLLENPTVYIPFGEITEFASMIR